MKSVFSLSLLAACLLSNSAVAQGMDSSKILRALYDLGVRGEGTQIAAMSGMSTDTDGGMTEELFVGFSHIMGGSNYVARSVKLYSTAQKSVLVMTYQAEETQDSLVTKTRIIEVNSDAAKVIAELVKANSAPTEINSSPTLKILAYSVESISCGRGVFPGATAHCQIK